MRNTLQRLYDQVLMGRYMGPNARADLVRYAGQDDWSPGEMEQLQYLCCCSEAIDRLLEPVDDQRPDQADLAGHMLAEAMSEPALFLDLVEKGCAVARDSLQMEAGLGHIGPSSYELATWGAVAKATVTK